jgi:hypothetical protein
MYIEAVFIILWPNKRKSKKNTDGFIEFEIIVVLIYKKPGNPLSIEKTYST